MADWSTVASLATAGGTLVLAAATFSSVRATNRYAVATERMMLAGLRPVLVASRAVDSDIKVMWADRHMVKLGGGRASVEYVDDAIYLAIGLRNTGAGIAVLHGWYVHPDYDLERPHPEPDEFRRLTRDLYIAPNDTGFWQAAIRDADDPEHDRLAKAIQGEQAMTVDLLYGDQEGGQRTISRFGIFPADGGSSWMCSNSRHWNLDRPDPR
jgi:hypothetical protein